MQIIRDLETLRSATAAWRRDAQNIAFVPTMGALHAGHMALIAEAKKHGDQVVASIFVNPLQFGANEDLDAYPRREQSDAAMLREAGCTALWMPPVDVMYPAGFASNISVCGVSEGLDGAARPGHFDGVATVVAKLFHQVQPDSALFGEKDYQQLAVIRRMVRDLNFDIIIIGVPTQRDNDGLALSSRNAYLTDAERHAALALPRTLGEAAQGILAGGDVIKILDEAVKSLENAGFTPIDYISLCDAETLEVVTHLERPARLLAAAKMGKTRLIDNLAIAPPSMVAEKG